MLGSNPITFRYYNRLPPHYVLGLLMIYQVLLGQSFCFFFWSVVRSKMHHMFDVSWAYLFGMIFLRKGNYCSLLLGQNILSCMYPFVRSTDSRHFFQLKSSQLRTASRPVSNSFKTPLQCSLGLQQPTWKSV